MKILVVDDTPVSLKILAGYCTKQGFAVVTAGNGAEAVEAFSREAPDLILMDVMMPVMDGFEATSKIKAACEDRWVPILLVTAMDDDQDLVKGVASGADDYLTKPVNLTLLGEKIKVMRRIARMQSKLSESLAELTQHHDVTQEEIRLGKHVMDRLVRVEENDDEFMQHWVLPAQHFSGDLVASAKTPGNVLHLIMADGTGHGLSAALCMTPVTEVFYTMTEKGFSISSIAEELNRKIKRLMPPERFVAAVLVSIDRANKTIEIWNGGGPAPVFMSQEGRLLYRWESTHLPLGILGNGVFEGKTELYQWETPGGLYLHSDGLSDARDDSGKMFGSERVLQLLTDTPHTERFERLRRTVVEHLGKASGEDDISLVAVQCPIDFELPSAPPVRDDRPTTRLPSQWRLELCLSAEEMKTIHIIPFLLAWLGQTGLRKEYCERFFMILSEIYNNALDHGILGLDSGMKLLSQGFEQYLNLRSERLSALQEGRMDIALERTRRAGEDRLCLRVKDSGAGFEFMPWLNADRSKTLRPYGRGIFLVRTIASKMEYLGNGNEVTVEYRLAGGDDR